MESLIARWRTSTSGIWSTPSAGPPLLAPPSIRPGIDLADVERRLLASEDLPASDRERLIGSVRELAEVYGRLGGSKAA